MRSVLPILSLLGGFFLLLPSLASGQSTLFTADFEGFSGWQVAGPASPNTWITDNCAGNGPSLPGTKAAYITSGGTVAGCGPTGTSHYGYVNAASGSNAVIFYRAVTNTCFSSLQITFDLQVDGAAGQDFTELVYSLDNGATWIAASTTMSGIPTWQTQTVTLPAALDNTSFRIGFRFTYDNTTISGNPPAVDNVKLQGTSSDITPPTAICPATFNIYANAGCTATVPDLPPSVTKSDNCTAASDLLISQSPAIGSSVSATTTATITVTDQAGNPATCTTSLVFIDTISPAITCPMPQTVPANSSCSYTLTDMTSLGVATDNCTASGSLTFSQTPAVGTALSIGATTIILHATDASGNTGSCTFLVDVNDTTAPVVSCPAYVNVPANAICIAHVGDLTGIPVVTDNCTTNPNLMSFSQVPAELMAFSDTILATIYVADEYGNVGQCVLHLVAADTVPPVVTCLSDTTVFTTNPCNYFIPNLSAHYAATDACSPSNLLTFSQSPAMGTASSGVTSVTTSITDPFGNVGVCVTQVHPTDVVAPTITCPGNQTINNGVNCNYTVAGYTGMVAVTDNCSNYTLVQSPAAGIIVGSGSNTITMTVTDAGFHQSTCTFELIVHEFDAPSIQCPGNITSCDAEVSYSTPTGSDNCLFVVVQTDNSGLTSGSIFPQGITTQTYAAIDSSGNTTTCTFTVEVFEIPDPAVISTDTIELCNTFTSAISATAVTSGTPSWSILQGGGTIANTGAASTTVSNLSIGINKLMWSVSSPSCGTKRDTLVIVVWPLPSTAHVQDTLVACTEVGLLLQATAPQFGTGTWTSNSGIVFANVHAPITAISNTNGGNHTIFWTVSSGICPSSSDTLFMELPNVAHIGQNDTTLCEQNLPLVLTGSAPSNEQQPIWSVLSGEAAFSNNYISQTSLTATSIGVVQILYWLTHPVCGSTTDTLILYVNDCNGLLTDIPTLFTPNHDHKNDVFDIPDLGLNYPGCRVEIYNRWGGLVFESDGYVNPWDGTFKGEDTPMGTYFYHIRLNDADDTRFNGSISIIR